MIKGEVSEVTVMCPEERQRVCLVHVKMGSRKCERPERRTFHDEVYGCPEKRE